MELTDKISLSKLIFETKLTDFLHILIVVTFIVFSMSWSVVYTNVIYRHHIHSRKNNTGIS
jgi:hypothetical protein